MKRVSFLVLIAMTMSLVLVSCGGASTPVDMEKKLYSYVQKGDFEKAFDYQMEISGSSKEEVEAAKAMGITAAVFAEKMKAEMDAKGGLKDFEVTETANNGEVAELEVKLTYGNGTENVEEVTYKMVDGKWRRK